MGVNVSQFSQIDGSSLVSTGIITSCPLYSVNSCVSKLASFKETTIIQYKKESNPKLPYKLTSSATFKAFVGTEFTQEKLVDHALQVKHLSHPSIIRVVSTAISPKIPSLFLVSEPNLPLQIVLSAVTKDEFLMGIFSILQAIDFLHTKAHISHNNIDSPSLFIDSRKKWKLGLFEFSCTFNELSQHRLEVLEILKNKDDQKAVEFIESASHGYDIYCFSRMVIKLLSAFAFEISDLKTVLERSGLHASPKQRPSAAQLLKHSVFKTPFSHIVSFLSEYVLKSDAERFKFFDEFPKLAREISEEVLCSSVVPLILVPSVFTDFPAKSLVRHLLTPFKEGSSFGLVSEAAFARLVVPQISRLFRCHELTTRMLLLQHFQAYARFMGRETLKTIVLPEICMGVYDSNEGLAAASLSGLAHLAHLLGTSLVMSHFQSLGAQMEGRSFLTMPPLSDVDKASLSLYTTLTTAPTKKPLVYTASKRPWRCTRTSFFPDSAPKANRQARDPPPETPIENGNAGKTSRLADMAMLSANYVPMAAPVKRVPNVGPPIVKKISSTRPVKNPRPFSSICPSVNEEEKIPMKELEPPIEEGVNKKLVANGVKMPNSSPSLENNSPVIQSNSSTTPAHSPVVVTPDIADDGDDQWNDWNSDTEDDKLANKMTSSVSLKSSQTSTLSREEEELREREAQVEALLAELEPKITPRSSFASPPRSTLDLGDLTSNSSPLTPTSATTSLRYKVENFSGDLSSGNNNNKEDGDDGDGWKVDDEDF